MAEPTWLADLFLRPAVNTSMWAWGPRPCGPQSQKEVGQPSRLDNSTQDKNFRPQVGPHL